MANSDYSVVGTGQFCPVARLTTGMSPGTTVIGVTDLRMVEPGDVANGSLILIGDEIMQIVSLGSPTWTVKRGCLDTIPAGWAAGQTIFVIDRFIGSNFVEYLGSQTVSVKLLAKAVGGVVPMEYAPPNQVTFNQRFARPYPPANFRLNGQPWYLGASVDSDTPLQLTWNQRNRVLQADQVLGHTDAGVTPEDGTTYELTLLTEGLTQVAQVTVPEGTSHSMTLADLRTAYGLTSITTGTYDAVLSFASKRDGLTSLQKYLVNLTLELNTIPEGTDTSPSVLLLRFNGTEGSTATVDESGNNIPVQFVNNAVVTRSLPIFPAGALVLPSPPPPAQKSYLKIGTGTQVPSQISSAFGSGSWTVEGFASVGASENSYMTVLALEDTSGGVIGKPEFAIVIGAQNSSPNILLYLSGTLFLPNTTTRSPQPARNQRFHWAVVCDDDKMRWFIDGKSIIVRTDGTNVYDWVYMGAPALSTGELLVGASANGVWSQGTESAIGALKVSSSAKYVGAYSKINTGGQGYVYASDFTPPEDFAPAA